MRERCLVGSCLIALLSGTAVWGQVDDDARRKAELLQQDPTRAERSVGAIPPASYPLGPGSLVCNGFVDFNAGIPGDWAIIDSDGSGLIWAPTAAVPGGLPGDCGEMNYTSPPSGGGEGACASSDVFGTSSYDTELRTPDIDVSGQAFATLDIVANYQAIGVPPTADNFDVDVSTNSGASWTTVFEYMDDTPVGGLRIPPGVANSINLDAFVGGTLMIRFRYYNPSPTAFDWYANIDDVSLICDIPVELIGFEVD